MHVWVWVGWWVAQHVGMTQRDVRVGEGPVLQKRWVWVCVMWE